MHTRHYLLTAVGVTILLLAGPTAADWAPNADTSNYIMHLPLLPDTSAIAWAVDATYPNVIADDWVCTLSGEDAELRGLHFWGAWKNGEVDTIIKFTLTHYYSAGPNPDTPYSRPGLIAKQWEVYNYQITDSIFVSPVSHGWYNRRTGDTVFNDCSVYYQYNVFLGKSDWVDSQNGWEHWLSITAHVPHAPDFLWGWLSSPHRSLATGVWADWGVLRWDTLSRPPAFTDSLDFSFVIDDGPPCNHDSIRGDVNYDSLGPNIVDLTYLVNYLFSGGSPPPCWDEGDVDNDFDNRVNIADLAYLAAYLFGDPPGPPPRRCYSTVDEAVMGRSHQRDP